MDAFPDDLREFWQRLRWARMRSPFETAADTARSLGIKPGTYRTYERPADENGRNPDLSELQRIAKKLKVSWTWLASGSGRPDDGAVEVDDRAVLVAQRIDRYANLCGRENVVAGVDCGFSIHVGMGGVDPDVTYAKLKAMADGAKLASGKYWGRAG